VECDSAAEWLSANLTARGERIQSSTATMDGDLAQSLGDEKNVADQIFQ